MKSLLVGYSLFCIACFVCVISQRVPDAEPSGRRGDLELSGRRGDPELSGRREDLHPSGRRGGDPEPSGRRGGDPEPSGRRGDVLTMGDVADQTVFNIDNTGGGGGTPGGGGGGGGGGSPLDCAKIMAECQCGRVPPTPGPQMSYNSYHGYNR